MTTYNRGDVILVPFPFSDQTATKQRPAVVVSTDSYNTSGPDLIIAAVTSNIVAPLGIGDCRLVKWREAGLLKLSVVKAMLAPIEKTLVRRKLGSILKKDMDKIDEGLAKALGLKT